MNWLSRGVGYGICQRVLLQLCQRDPSDSHPQPPTPGDVPALPETGYKGVTLIMACRNMKRADAARTKLLHWFSQQIREVERKTLKKEDKEHARAFSRDCDVKIAELDLASFGSVVEFSTRIKQLSVVFVLFFASSSNVDYLYAECLTSPISCSTLESPASNPSITGLISSSCSRALWPQLLRLCITSNTRARSVLITLDGCGNPTFSVTSSWYAAAITFYWRVPFRLNKHTYIQFRELEPLLSKAPFDAARVIWSSSLEASPTFYDSEDWQLIKTDHSYETAKYQIDLIATHLDQLARLSMLTTPVRHFVSEPGVCSTLISQALVGPFTNLMKVLSFYLVRTPRFLILLFFADS